MSGRWQSGMGQWMNVSLKFLFMTIMILTNQWHVMSGVMVACVNETAIFPFTKTPTTINFKLLSTSHRAPLSGRPIDNTHHHSLAIHSTYVTIYYISKGFHSNPRPPRRYHCSTNVIVCQCLSYTDIVGDPPERRYCLIEQLGAMEDQGNNDVVIGVGQMACSQKRRRNYNKIRNMAPAIKQAQKRRFFGCSLSF